MAEKKTLTETKEKNINHTTAQQKKILLQLNLGGKSKHNLQYDYAKDKTQQAIVETKNHDHLCYNIANPKKIKTLGGAQNKLLSRVVHVLF